jgi:uncharacterized protein (TIGR02453 family)
MLQPSTLQFLTDLKNNNDKVWFDANRKRYETAKKDFEQFIGDMLQGLTVLDPGYASQKAKDCTFRIFRDVRFSKDKSPYKANFGAALSPNGKKVHGAGFYFHLEPGQSFIGGGVWMPEGPVLKAIRQEIDYNFEDFKKMLQAPSFKKWFKTVDGERLKTVPQGYSADNPAIEYLKLKSFTVGTALNDSDLTKSGLVKKSVQIFSDMNPFISFLNTAISAG